MNSNSISNLKSQLKNSAECLEVNEKHFMMIIIKNE